MAVPYNNTDCLNPSSVQVDYPAAPTMQGLLDAVSKILDRLQEVNDASCASHQDSINKQNLSNVLISELGTRLNVVENIAIDLKNVLGLSSEQVSIIQEAASFLVDEDGNTNTLGTLVQNYDALKTAVDSFNSVLITKADKSVTDNHEARIASLEAGGIDLSGYASLTDLCSLSTSVTNKLSEIATKTATAFTSLSVVLQNAADSIKQSVDDFTLNPCTLPDYTPATLPSAPANLSGSDDGAPV